MVGYADYEYYKNVYMGTSVNEEDFTPLSIKASRYIDHICCTDITESTECVRLAVCAVCDVLFEIGAVWGIKSESNDGYSVTYNIDDDAQYRRIYEAARIYLDDGLLYRGIL